MALPGLTPLDDVAHIIQVALTPVFLLSGIGTLLNVFAGRLARVADQIDRIVEQTTRTEPVKQDHLAQLRRRLLALDTAVILGAFGGAAICGAVLMLFYGALRDAAVASVLYGLFAASILCTIAALAAFVYEMMIASHVLRVRVASSADAARRSVFGFIRRPRPRARPASDDPRSKIP